MKAKPRSIRLSTVEINAAGPISGFRASMAPLTLIYAGNERGKTTIVENLVACLFRERKDGLHRFLRREFVGASRVTVQGLSGKPVVFSSIANKKKLDDFIETMGSPFPSSLFDLLVVRGAEVEILEQRGGVTRSYLKSLISPQRLLETLQDRLPSEIGYTELEGGILLPKRRIGAYKTYEEARKRLESLEKIADRFYDSLSHADLMNSLSRKTALEQEKKQLQLAKRHTAFVLHRSIGEVESELDRLDETGVEEFSDTLKDYFRFKAELSEYHEGSRREQQIHTDLNWLEQARKRYEYCLKSRASLPQTLSFLAVGVTLIGALAVYFLAPKLLPFALILTLPAFAFALLFTFVIRRTGAPESVRAEIGEIKQAFKARFGTALHSPMDFDPAKSQLDRELGKAQAAEGKRDSAATAAEQLLRRIRDFLTSAGTPQIEESQWLALADKLKNRTRQLRIDGNRYEERLRSLGVVKIDYLEQAAELEYSREREREIEQELDEVQTGIREDQDKDRELQERFSEHIGREAAHSQSNEILASAIEGKREQYRSQARDSLAEMIAGHVVAEILRDFHKLEDERLESALNDPRICGLIREFTGRYDRISLQDERLFIENEEQSYDLAEMSSGAREQILLALRMGIASTLCGNQGLFLILDDAFQYSDWQRRQALVQQAVKAVRSGWQVIYLTMDDDLRDRFGKAADQLEQGTFKLIEL